MSVFILSLGLCYLYISAKSVSESVSMVSSMSVFSLSLGLYYLYMSAKSVSESVSIVSSMSVFSLSLGLWFVTSVPSIAGFKTKLF